ncbi:acyltransferase family protein [Pelomonas sp. SE-A7]|uniref:acyltransferase family protein n=1 Tax=Pelomonas sp. SE-A7 TaxID=3054953 RepID=UPI00259C9BAD|nr:acyltransferase family protein [Pelomonas sp. SE-A7]MDM4768048.1 acyltransferase family protein [Pelomonas sp. SE-A7]
MKDTQRQYFLDWLRILAFGLLVPYHVGMYYVSWDWHVKSASASDAIEPLMLLSSPWRLGLLFLVAGAAAHHLLTRKPEGFVASRSKRLLWPLIFGMFVIVPPQAFYEVQTKLAYGGSYLDFMQLYVKAFHGFCGKEGKCLDLPTWNHLWFVAYLWVYSLVGWALWKLLPQLATELEAWLEKPRGALFTLGLLALPLMAARQLASIFPSTHNLSWDWYNHLQYGGLFLLGLYGAHSRLWELMQQWRRWALGLALLGWALLMVYFFAYAKDTPPDTLRTVMRCLWGGLQWWATCAACGFAKQWLDRDHPARRWLTPAIFCVYILHQSVIVLLTRALLPLSLPPLVEGLLLIALTFAICLIGYLVARRVPVLRGALGISDSGRPAPGRAATMRPLLHKALHEVPAHHGPGQ